MPRNFAGEPTKLHTVTAPCNDGVHIILTYVFLDEGDQDPGHLPALEFRSHDFVDVYKTAFVKALHGFWFCTGTNITNNTTF